MVAIPLQKDEHIAHLNPVQKQMYFKDESFCLYLGDCLDVMSSFPENYVDMIFADPPYNLSNNGFTCQNGKMVSVNKGDWDKSKGLENDFLFHRAWIDACRRVLKPNGTIWISGTYHSIYQCGFILQELDYHILNDIAWYKPNASPNLSCRFFTASHETILWARKNHKASHIFHYNEMKDGLFPGDFIKKPHMQMRSVWSINTPKPSEKKYGKHPTQKPIELLRRIITASTDEGSIILDPFNGGGTTGIAATLIGKRKYIGIDVDSSYLELTKLRYSDAKGELIW